MAVCGVAAQRFLTERLRPGLWGTGGLLHHHHILGSPMANKEFSLPRSHLRGAHMSPGCIWLNLASSLKGNRKTDGSQRHQNQRSSSFWTWGDRGIGLCSVLKSSNVQLRMSINQVISEQITSSKLSIPHKVQGAVPFARLLLPLYSLLYLFTKYKGSVYLSIWEGSGT